MRSGRVRSSRVVSGQFRLGEVRSSAIGGTSMQRRRGLGECIATWVALYAQVRRRTAAPGAGHGAELGWVESSRVGLSEIGWDGFGWVGKLRLNGFCWDGMGQDVSG